MGNNQELVFVRLLARIHPYLREGYGLNVFLPIFKGRRNSQNLTRHFIPTDGSIILNFINQLIKIIIKFNVL